MKINIAAIYWLVFWGLFLSFMTVFPLLFTTVQSLGYKLWNVTFVPVEINAGNIGNYIATVLTLVFFVLLHILMLKKVKFIWYFCVCIYILSCLVTLSSLSSVNFSSSFQLLLPEIQASGFASLFIFFQILVFGTLFMNFFTLFALLHERRLFGVK